MLVQMLLAVSPPLAIASSEAQSASMIRVAYIDDTAGAVVSVNGVVKGECH